MTDRQPRQHQTEVAGILERPVLPTGALRRTSRLAALPLRHAARSAVAASRLSRVAADQVAARTAEQVFATLGELKGGAAKLGQAMAVFEAAMPEEVAAPYRSALRRLTDAAPAMPAEVARRIVEELDYVREGLDFGAVVATPGGIPVPFGQLAAAVLAGDGPTAISLARRIGALGPGAQVDPRLIIELLHPLVATAAAGSFTYSRPWLRGLMAHFTEARFVPALRNLTPPPEYALVWRATLSAAGLFAQLGATVPTRGFHLAYSPGFRSDILAGPAAPKAAAG